MKIFLLFTNMVLKKTEYFSTHVYLFAKEIPGKEQQSLAGKW